MPLLQRGETTSLTSSASIQRRSEKIAAGKRILQQYLLRTPRDFLSSPPSNNKAPFSNWLSSRGGMEISSDVLNIKIKNDKPHIGDGDYAATPPRISIAVCALVDTVISIKQDDAFSATGTTLPTPTGIGVDARQKHSLPPPTAGMGAAIPMAGSAGAGVYSFSLVDKDFAADSPDNPDRRGIYPSGIFAFVPDNPIGVPDNPSGKPDNPIGVPDNPRTRGARLLTFAVSGG